MQVEVKSYHGPEANPSVPEPYRIFFPLGVLAGVIGVSLWPLYALGILELLPVAIHVDFQIHGFLFAFVLGFLLTALPRFSQTWPITRWELMLFLLFFIGGNGATLAGRFAWGRGCYVAGLLMLVLFALQRLVKRKANPPEEFAFVGFGILLGLIGAACRLASTVSEEWVILELPGRRLLTEGMMLALVLGVGGKLVPLFFGFGPGTPTQQPLSPPKFFTPKRLMFTGVALLFALTFVAEYSGFVAVAHWTRALIATGFLLGVFKVVRRPREKGILVWTLWGASWAVLLSLWGTAFHPAYRVAVLHILFLGGFSILIFCIATRVILAHGGFVLSMEKKSVTLLVGALLIFIALVFRAIADLFPEQYFFLLGVAGAIWIVGLLMWGSVFTKRALFRKNSQLTEEPVQACSDNARSAE